MDPMDEQEQVILIYFDNWNEKSRFGLEKQAVRFVIEHIAGEISSTTDRNHDVSPTEMVYTALRFLATGSFLQVVGDFGGIQEHATVITSSQSDWGNNDFTESQGGAFSSAFAAHRKLINLYTEAESEVRMRQNVVEELEKKLVAARASLTQSKQLKTGQDKNKLLLVWDTFMFKDNP